MGSRTGKRARRKEREITERENEEREKRERENERESERDGRNQKRRIDRDNNGIDELVVYRILCPDRCMGSVIGKSGKVINSIRQETGAKVKVVDPFPGAKDRVIIIYCYVKEKEDVEVDGEFNDKEPLCPAQDAVLKVHTAIANAVGYVGDPDKKQNVKEECQLLVPSSQSANIIGKSGVTIKKLRRKTGTEIKVTPKDTSNPTHSCALEFDNFVLISGDSDAVKKALFAVSAIMYKFTPKEEIPLETSVPEAPPSIIIPSDIPIYHAAGLYPSVDPVAPSRPVPSILGPTHALPNYPGTGSTWPVYSSALPVVSGFSAASEELTIKVLCPSNKIGRVIGKGGSSIKSLRQASGACVEVDDTKTDREDSIITITSTESLDDLKSMAIEAVLLLQEKINDEDDDTVTIRLLVPSKFIGGIIGKNGSVINEIRKRTKSDIRISKGEKPKRANGNDELVEVVGQVGSVRDALIQIVLRLRDGILKDLEGGRNQSAGTESLYSGGAGLPLTSVFPSLPPVAPLSYEQRAEPGSGVSLHSSSSLYGYGSLSVGDNGYGSLSSYSSQLYGGLPQPASLEMVVPANAVGKGGANRDNIHKVGDNGYGSLTSYSSKLRLPQPSSLEMVVPANAVSKVIGKGGANIDNIRKISGAAIEIFDSKSSRGDCVALISGTPEQERSAKNLIQAFIMAT